MKERVMAICETVDLQSRLHTSTVVSTLRLKLWPKCTLYWRIGSCYRQCTQDVFLNLCGPGRTGLTGQYNHVGCPDPRFGDTDRGCHSARKGVKSQHAPWPDRKTLL